MTAANAARPLRSRVPRWCELLALLVALSAVAQVAIGDDLPASREYQLKAAFLYNFTKLIEWPAPCFADAHSPIVIAVLGSPSLAGELERVAQGHIVNGRAIVVRRVATPEDAYTAHVLFVSAQESADIAAMQSDIQSRPIVTVGESASFATVGGIINFIVAEDRVRFEINTASAERSGLRISAQLQKLATRVTR